MFGTFRLASLALACGMAFFSGAPLALAENFELIATQTPAGSVGPGLWNGVLRYSFTGTGSAATPEVGIPAASVADPAGLAYSSVDTALYVGNRHGNGASSSINTFDHAIFGGFTPGTTVTGNSMFGVHQLTFSPSGELFAANVNGPISRFTITGGTVSPNGTINSGASRGVAVSPDGTRLYYTAASGVIRQWDLTNNIGLSDFAVAGALNLHYLRYRSATELYAADFSGKVFSFDVLPNGDLALDSSFSSPNAIALDFSPDGAEMFVAGHSSGIISRYLLQGDAWSAAGSIDTGTSLGDLIILPSTVPEPASLAVLSLGSLALLARRRK